MALPRERLDTEAVQLHGQPSPTQRAILDPQALAFRRARQARWDAGDLPDFRADTAAIRESEWTVGPIPPALRDRRVEITGPVERKMIINALNSGAKVFMADFEDSSAPSFANQLDG